MRVTLLGVLTLVGIAVLIVYAGYELHRASQERNAQPQQNPNLPEQP